MHIDSDEVSQVPTSSSTDTRMARSDRSVPGLPPGIFARGNMRQTASQQSQASETPTIPAALDSRLQRMDQVLSLFDPNIRQSSDTQHLSYNALPQALRILATELDRTRGEIRSGTGYIWTELSRIDGWIIQMEKASEMLQMAYEQVTERLDDQDARHQARSSQLHQSIQAEGSAAMARDEEIGRELLDQRAQNQQALRAHGQALREVIQELRACKEERRQQEGRIAELSELVISLNAQVKGKGKRSDPTPEPSPLAAGGGNGGNRPPPPQQAATGAPGGGDSDDDDDDEEGPDKGRRDERPARKGKGPEEKEEEEEATWDDLRFSRALGKAIGDTTKQPAQPPPEYEHAKHQDVRFWLTACKDFFDRNPYQWQDEADRIKYALSKLKGPQVSAFAMTYRNQMTGELGYTRQEGYELWNIFTEQMVRRFGLTHEEEKSTPANDESQIQRRH